MGITLKTNKVRFFTFFLRTQFNSDSTHMILPFCSGEMLFLIYALLSEL